MRKNYAGADVVCYLPFDTTLNAQKFVKLARPEAAYFIKYEFWRNYIEVLHRNGVPTYSVSSIFRPNQVFSAGTDGDMPECCINSRTCMCRTKSRAICC